MEDRVPTWGSLSILETISLSAGSSWGEMQLPNITQDEGLQWSQENKIAQFSCMWKAIHKISPHCLVIRMMDFNLQYSFIAATFITNKIKNQNTSIRGRANISSLLYIQWRTVWSNYEESSIICDNMDEPWNCHIKWNKPAQCQSYFSTYLWNMQELFLSELWSRTEVSTGCSTEQILV
jgi:hypothetical protein